MSVGGHRAKRREVCHMYGDFFFRPGAFRAGGCVRLRAGTVCAYRDRIPVPRRARCPRPRWVVPDGVDCPRPFRGESRGKGKEKRTEGRRRRVGASVLEARELAGEGLVVDLRRQDEADEPQASDGAGIGVGELLDGAGDRHSVR